jgi:hypothetical protein
MPCKLILVEGLPGSGKTTMAGGVVLILLGLLLLGQNLHLVALKNWWALFILLPAVGSLGTAWRLVQAASGRFTWCARSAAFLGLMLTLVTAVFVFELNWFLLGPGLLIAAGLGTLINALLPE